MDEGPLVRAIQAALTSRGGRVLRGPGDDAAVVRADPCAVVSIDAMVENVHFRLDHASPADVGHRALAGALSDIAAMEAWVKKAVRIPSSERATTNAATRQRSI